MNKNPAAQTLYPRSPNTSGTSRNIAVTNFFPRIFADRTAGYQKSQRNPAFPSRIGS